MSRAIVNILKNDAALTALLGSNTKVRTGTVAQGVEKPYVIVDIEDSDPTNSFDAASDLDFVRLTISSVSDRYYTNDNGVGTTEIAKAVRNAIDFVSAGTYGGETITRCTFERSGFIHEDRLSNNVQITKEDEYLVSVRNSVIVTPTNLAAVLFGYNVPDLTWIDGTAGSSDSYEIWRSENGGSFSLLDSTANADNYRDSSITGDTSRFFSYKVRAVKDGIKSLFSNESGVVTTEIRAQLFLDVNLDFLTLDGLDVAIEGDQSGNGYDFIQATAANRPVVDSVTAPSNITFTAANSEFLENTADVAAFANMNQGCVGYINDGITRTMMAVGDTTVVSGDILFGVDGGKADMLIKAGAASFTSTSIVPVGASVLWQTDGSIIRCFIDKVEDVVIEVIGLNTGQWLADLVSVNQLAIGKTARTSDVYFDTVFKHAIIRSTPLTSLEIQQWSDGVKVKHGL